MPDIYCPTLSGCCGKLQFAVTIEDRVQLFHLNRHQLAASRILTMILHQHGGHQLIERVLPLSSDSTTRFPTALKVARSRH